MTRLILAAAIALCAGEARADNSCRGLDGSTLCEHADGSDCNRHPERECSLQENAYLFNQTTDNYALRICAEHGLEIKGATSSYDVADHTSVDPGWESCIALIVKISRNRERSQEEKMDSRDAADLAEVKRAAEGK